MHTDGNTVMVRFVLTLVAVVIAGQSKFACSAFLEQTNKLSQAYIDTLDSIVGGARAVRHDKLALLYLFVFPHGAPGLGADIALDHPTQRRRLQCHLQLMAAHFVSTTPVDALIFTKHAQRSSVATGQQQGADSQPPPNTAGNSSSSSSSGVNATAAGHHPPLSRSAPGFNYEWAHFLPVDDSHWELPAWTAPHGAGFNWNWDGPGCQNYKIMGQWRILIAFQAAHALGYEYGLIIDDDVLMRAPVGFNILNFARQKQLDMAFYTNGTDTPDMYWGLPELAAFFLACEHMKPAGPLFSHCRPPNVTGLFTAMDESKGFDRTTFITYFALARLDFWMSPKVQEFIRLAVVTAQARFRWQEQAVATFVRLIFVPDERFHLFNQPPQALNLWHTRDKQPLRTACPDLYIVNPQR